MLAPVLERYRWFNESDVQRMVMAENSFQSNTEHKIEYYQPIDWDGFTLWDESTANQPIGNPDDGICDFPALIDMIQEAYKNNMNNDTVRETLEKIIVKNPSEWHQTNNNGFINWLKRNLFPQTEIDNIMECIKLQQFGDKVEVLKSNPAVYHYHPARFVEQMREIIPLVSTFNPYFGQTLSSDAGSINLQARTQSNIQYNPGFAPLTEDPYEKNWIEYNGQHFGKSSGLYNVKRNTATGIHTGVDFRTGGKNTEIKSFIYGEVLACTWSGTPDLKSSYGKMMIIKDANSNKLYMLGHLNDYRKEPGEKVSPGDTVAIAGTTGSSTGIHLHLEVFIDVPEKIETVFNINVCKKHPFEPGFAWFKRPTRVNPFDHTEVDHAWKGGN